MVPLQLDDSEILWIMNFSAFFDESGKFRDSSVIAFCGIAFNDNNRLPFMEEWNALLHRTGLKTITMKEALHHDRDLSKKKPARGLQNRIDALLPFVQCVRRNVSLIVSMAVDVVEFKKLPSHAREILGKNPHYFAFTRALMQLAEPLHRSDLVGVVCDDEEETALQMYKLYRKVRIAWPDARERLISLSFANDEVFTPLQAADMMAGLIRLYARKEFLGENNPYQDLLAALASPDTFDKLWGFEIGLFDKEHLEKMAAGFLKMRDQYGEKVGLFEFSSLCADIK
jgi:hypothetical protein